MIFQKLRARAHIRSFDDSFDQRLPVSSVHVRYSLNAFPRAFFQIPYGYSLEDDSTTEFIDARNGYEVSLELKESSYWTGWHNFFSGFITSVSQVERRSYEGGGRATRIKAVSYLSYLDQQMGHSMDYGKGGIWFGTSNMRDVVGQPLDVEGSLRDGEVVVQKVLRDYLLQVTGDQQAGHLDYFNEGASRAETVINQGWSTDPDISHPIFPFDYHTRDVMAHAITSFLAGSDGSLWKTILAFCNHFNYAVAPTAVDSDLGQVGKFAVVPIMRPGAVPYTYRKKLYIDEETSVRSESKESRPIPIQKVMMLSRKRSSPWNLSAEESTYFVLQMASLDERRPGSTEAIQWPGWFPGNKSPWSNRIARLLCRQRLLDRRFKNEQLQVRCPRLINYSPGTVVQLQGIGRYLPNTEDYNMVGLIDGVEVHMNAGSKEFYTQFSFTQPMSEDSYEALALGVHPVTWSYGYMWSGQLFSA